MLDHWDRVGDWTQQWLNLRYVVRLLVRLGAETTRRCCTTPWWPRASRRRSTSAGPGLALPAAEAVALARESLSRYR